MHENGRRKRLFLCDSIRGIFYNDAKFHIRRKRGIGPLRRRLEQEKYVLIKTKSVHKQRSDKIRTFYAFLRVDRWKI